MDPEFNTGDFNGPGEMSQQDLVDLRKALEIGYTQPTTGAGFDALRVESLEATLKLLTFSQTNLAFWNEIPKLDAYSTVEEYNKLLEYGSEGGGFVPSGTLPEEDDSSYVRADQKVKYIGTTRAVHHPATLVRTVPADLIAQETQNGALWLMGKANRALYYGDATSIPEEWNGIVTQLLSGSGHVIDCAGVGLAQADLENGAELIVENFGNPSTVLSNPRVFTDFSKTAYQYQRLSGPNINAGMLGTPINGFKSISGEVNFRPDIFVRRGAEVSATPTSTKAPPAPVLTVSSAAAVAAGTSFVTADAGTYKYQVTAMNRYGESAPTAISGGTVVAANEKVPLSIADSGGLYPATAYRLYRTEKNGLVSYSTQYTIPRATSGGTYTTPTTYDDTNAWRPRTFMTLMLDMSSQVLAFKQLAPMMKMNLAIVSPAIRWMQLLYGTPILYAPKRAVLYKNVGIVA